MTQYNTIRLILGDQLNPRHSWFQEKDASILYVVMESIDEARYVKHHVQKICAFFAAMERFATALSQAGHPVLHLTLDDTHSLPSVAACLIELCETYSVTLLEYQQPDEYRLQQSLAAININGVQVHCVDSEHFLLPFHEIPNYFKANTAVRMEHFYRKMRKRFDILMASGGQPEGQQWNFDQENRQNLQAKDIPNIPEPLIFSNPVTDILQRIQRHQIPTIGSPMENLLWPIDRQQSLQLLRFFCDVCLPNFGRFQDAMTHASPHKWSLYHSRLSFAINSKMLHPMQVIQAAIQAYRKNPDNINLAQVEGFIRQILGWREYVRGMYWINMPNYQDTNHLSAQNTLPEFFWTGDTKMRCLQQAISQSLDYAYAHHIQRLMVTGNFCLLTEINPIQVDEWYLGIYVDAIEWVELPNTRGMSQFADGGLIASKPYAASGNYINKMSDYCKGCHYQVKEKITDNACPLNSLYWRFMVKHREQLEKNPRIGMLFKQWDKQDKTQQQAILDKAHWAIEHVNDL